MIYEWIDNIMRILKTVRHWFRKLVCREYVHISGLGNGWCKFDDNGKIHYRCKFYNCPKRVKKEGVNE